MNEAPFSPGIGQPIVGTKEIYCEGHFEIDLLIFHFSKVFRNPFSEKKGLKTTFKSFSNNVFVTFRFFGFAYAFDL